MEGRDTKLNFLLSIPDKHVHNEKEFFYNIPAPCDFSKFVPVLFDWQVLNFSAAKEENTVRK
jgi:hypothetical protein